jgi:Family of unknown function (DUF6488)
MNDKLLLNRLKLNTRGIRIILLMLSILLLSAWTTSAHGPKGHRDMEFTALNAAKKGIELYDRLVASGKLPNSWETDLTDIQVLKRKNGHKNEFIVKFSRSMGEPKSVYIFFNEKGEYNGSNFTGQ